MMTFGEISADIQSPKSLQFLLNYRCNSPKKEKEQRRENHQVKHHRLKIYSMTMYVANNVGYHVPVDHLSLDVPLHHQLIAVCRHTDHCRDIGVVWQEHIVSTVSKVWKEILNIRREIFLWSFLRDFCNIPQLGFPRKQLLHLLASVSAFLRQFCPVLTLKRVF